MQLRITLKRHLDDLNRKEDYYDLILTGDLGLYGREILKEFMMKEHKINISCNYNDCGVMLYDLEEQKKSWPEVVVLYVVHWYYMVLF